MDVVSAEAPSRWLFSAVAALLTHGAVLVGMPEGSGPRIQPVEPLWMSVVSSGQASEAAGSSSAGEPAAAPRAGTVRPRTVARRGTAVARASTSARAHQAAPTEAAPTDVAPSSLSEGAGPSLSVEGVGSGAGDGVVAGAAGAAGETAGGTAAGKGVPATRPALIATPNPCLGYFPSGASVDHGRVQIEVRVDESGRARPSAVVVEAPAGHDFGRAARACAAALRFVPARDALGEAVAADAKLELHFHRS